MSQTVLVPKDRGQEIAEWVANGCPSPPPYLVKHAIIRRYIRLYGSEIFVETGSGSGDTTASVAALGIECHTIEIDTRRHAQIASRFHNTPNVTVHHGDSAILLPRLLTTLTRKALFWLDAHYSWDGLERADKETPINEELASVLGHAISGHVILIDDMRLFGPPSGERYRDYPSQGKLQEVFGKYNVHVELKYDIMRATPR